MSKKPKFQRPTGMRDILPEDQKYFQRIYNVVEDVVSFYGFQKIETPILEQTELFSKGVGMATDIVGKEMYSFRTKGGDYLTLRPEGTAPIVRAYIEQGMANLPHPIKLWHFGPFFRYEKPQLCRYREFWQFGFEVFGEENPVIDAQVIQISYNILKELNLKNLLIEINSIGDSQCRPYYKKLLASYLRNREQFLCANCKKRLRENPLRILDCKEEKCKRIVSQAPQIIDHLCEECHKHFKEVLEFLDEIELPYRLNPYLVRGLDYYTKTVFEIVEDSPEGRALGTLAAGGRYNTLVKLLGGKDTPAVGGSGGVERIIQAMKNKKIQIKKDKQPMIFLAQLGPLAKRKSLKLLEDFRKARIQATESFGRDSLKTQLSRADRVRAKYALILGQKEALDGTIIIRNMKTGRQETIKLDKVVNEIKRKLKK